MVGRRSRSRSSSSRWGSWLAWLLVLLVAALVGWLWWRSAYTSGQSELRALDLFEPPPGGDLEPVPTVPPGVPPTNLPRVPAPTTSSPAASNASRPGSAPMVLPPPPQFVPPSSTDVTNRVPTPAPVPVTTTDQIVAIQLALSRRGISSGAIDGVVGAQTRSAIRVFQREERLPVTGDLDAVTVERLAWEGPIYTNYVVVPDDLARLMPVPRTWLGKSSRDRLDYETILELVAERSHAHPRLVRQLNPGIDWDRVPPRTVVRVPDATRPPPATRAALVRISLSERTLRAYDARGALLAHFPCSIARRVEKRPSGELHVVKLASQPNYRFDPDIFQESAEARRIGRKLMIPAGPNNPVGTAWIGLDRPGYGIHGTPHPEEVGRTESHGCFRLANWNAEYLLKVAWVGMPVQVEP